MRGAPEVVDAISAVVQRTAELAMIVESPEILAFRKLKELDMPFSVRTPFGLKRTKDDGDAAAVWWVEVFDHPQKLHYTGSGDTLAEAVGDLYEGMIKIK